VDAPIAVPDANATKTTAQMTLSIIISLPNLVDRRRMPEMRTPV